MRDARLWFSFAVPVSLAALVGVLVPSGDTGDLPYFVHASQRLFSGGWLETYADPTLQVGPLQLALFGTLRSTALIGGVVGALCAALFWVVARRVLAGRGGASALLAAALAPVALGLTFDAYRDGHPAQVIVPLLWVLAALDVRSGRPWRAGALIGVSAGFEMWGVLGIAVLVLAPRARDAARAAVLAGVVVAAPLAPFVLGGEFGVFQYHWQVNGDTPLSLLVEPGTMFTWQLRVLQGAAALFAGALVASALRRTPAAVWAGPLALVCVRLALDPVRYPWYWLALETLAFVGAVQLLSMPRLALRPASRRVAVD